MKSPSSASRGWATMLVVTNLGEVLIYTTSQAAAAGVREFWHDPLDLGGDRSSAGEGGRRGVGTWRFTDLDLAGNLARHRQRAAESRGRRARQRDPGRPPGWRNSASRTPKSWSRYATRRGLLGQEEGDRLLAEVHAAEQRRADKAADRERALKAKARAKGKTVQAGEGGQEGEEGREGGEAAKARSAQSASRSGLELLHQRGQPGRALQQVPGRRRHLLGAGASAPPPRPSLPRWPRRARRRSGSPRGSAGRAARRWPGWPPPPAPPPPRRRAPRPPRREISSSARAAATATPSMPCTLAEPTSIVPTTCCT